VYLPPEVAGGFPYCFDPQSAVLRAAVANGRGMPAESLDAAALASDIRDLHGALKRLYAGYPDWVQSTRFDVDRFFLDWEDRVRRAGVSISRDEGIFQPLVMLRKHIRDNHLSVWGYGRRLAQAPELAFSEYQHEGRIEGFDGQSCTFEGVIPVPGTARHARLLGRNGLREVTTFSAQSMAPALEVVCRGVSARFDRRAPHALERPQGAPVYAYRTVGDATIVDIRRFYGSPDELAMLDRIARDYDTHRTKGTIVFDLRSNGGGNDGYIYDWLDRAAAKAIQAPYVALHVSSASACGDWSNFVLGQIEYKRIDTDEGKAERAAFLAKSPLGVAPGAPAQEVDAAPVVFRGRRPYRGKVFVLVDRASASSGESSADLLRLALSAVVVGERTGGYAEFGNMRPYVMPRTGIGWQLGSKRNYFPEPREGVGHPVDIYLDESLIGAPVEEILPRLMKATGR
jgi:hypothetical protein